METISNIFYQILPILIAIIVPTLSVLVAWMIKQISANFSTKNQALIADIINTAASEAITYAEQIATKTAAAYKEIHGQDKLNLAIEYALAELQKNGIVKVTAEELGRKIESLLGTRVINELPAITPSNPDIQGDLNEDTNPTN